MFARHQPENICRMRLSHANKAGPVHLDDLIVHLDPTVLVRGPRRRDGFDKNAKFL